MKKITFLLMIFCSAAEVSAQNYVDVIRANYNSTEFDDVQKTRKTNVDNYQLEFLYPKKFSENTTLLSGFAFENTDLSYEPASQFDANITMLRLNVGLKLKHSEKLSGTYMLLPKIASDLESSSSKNYQIGTLALLEYQNKENLKTKYGLYASTENYGTQLTPLFGLYYLSKNNKFAIDAVLPIRMDINYKLGNEFSVGSDLRTSIKSYHLQNHTYIQEESIRASMYLGYGFLKNKLLLRGKFGFDTTDFGVYQSNQKVGLQILTVANDNRTRLNNEFSSNLFYGLDLVYRFYY